MELILGNGGGEQGEGKTRILTLYMDRIDYHPEFRTISLSFSLARSHTTHFPNPIKKKKHGRVLDNVYI